MPATRLPPPARMFQETIRMAARTDRGDVPGELSVALRQAQHVLGQVVEHHLLGDRRDLVEPDLAPEPLDVELARVAVAAERLERRVARLEPGLRREELGGVRL